MVSRVLAKNYLKNLKRNIVSVLDEQGLFVKKFTVDLEATVLPFLIGIAMKDYNVAENMNNFLSGIVKEISAGAVKQHQAIVDEFLDKKQKEKEDKEKKAAETVERRKNRAAERARRAEQKRRDGISEQIGELLLAKQETKEKMFATVLSDLDSHGKDGGTVGLIGGLIGELLIFFSTIEELKAEVDFDYLKSLVINQDLIQEILDKIVIEYCEGGLIEVGVAPDTEGKIQAIDEALNFDTLFTNEAKKNDIENVLKAQIKSYLTTYIRKNLATFGLQENILDWILTTIVKTVTNPEETCKYIIML
jgi:hypothetical protein